MWRGGIGLEEEDPEPRGFQARVDLHALGAMTRFIREREREREREHITTRNKEYLFIYFNP